jgi:hypothetical protein
VTTGLQGPGGQGPHPRDATDSISPVFVGMAPMTEVDRYLHGQFLTASFHPCFHFCVMEYQEHDRTVLV